MEKRGLGKGLGALISGTLAQDDAASVREVAVDEITANPYQPRRVFDPEKLAELVQSVREHGILQPILLRRVGVDAYELIAGERRYRAARDAGLTRVPAIIKEYADAQMLEVALIENVQREDISAVEAAHAYQRLVSEFNMTQQEIADRVGKSQSSIANTLRLLSLPEPVLDSLQRGEISEGHARSLLQAPAEARISAWEDVRRRGLSVRETEKLARDLRIGRPEAPVTERPRTETSPIFRDPNHAAVEDALQTVLGTKVTIKRAGSIGRIEVEFYSDAQLEGLVERLTGK